MAEKECFTEKDAEAIENGIIQNPYRQFYLSLDVDLTKITTKSHFLKTLFSVLTRLKFLHQLCNTMSITDLKHISSTFRKD